MIHFYIKKILLKLLFVFFASIAVAQSICTPNTNSSLTTDPKIVGNWNWQKRPLLENTVLYNRFTQTSNSCVINSDGSQSYCIVSPFSLSSNPNVGYLNQEGPNGEDIRDYFTKDGWELFSKEIGTEMVGTGVTNPIIMLYNRYTGIMRVFVCIKEQISNYNGAVVKLELLDNDDQPLYADSRQAANLSFNNPHIKALNGEFVKSSAPNKVEGLILTTWNKFLNTGAENWVMADFNMAAYDPCVCSYQSFINVKVELISKGDLVLKTKGTLSSNANEKSLVQNGVVNNESNLINEIKGAGKSASKKFESTEKAIKDVNSFANNFYKTISKDTNKFAEIALVKNLSKSIPYVGAVIGFLEYFSGSSAKSASSSIQYVDLETTGTLTTTDLYKDYKILNGGAMKKNRASNEVPIYNNLLGIFNLLETPKIEYIDYRPTVERIQYFQYDGSFLKDLYTPRIREYRLSSPLKYVVNPASKLSLVDIKMSFSFKDNTSRKYVPSTNYGSNVITPENKHWYGPVELTSIYYPERTQSYEDRLKKNNLLISKWDDINNTNDISKITYLTPPLSQECFSNEKIKLYFWDKYDNENIHEIYLKLYLTFRDNITGVESYFVLTYDTERLSSSYNDLTRRYVISNIDMATEAYCPCWICDGIICKNKYRTLDYGREFNHYQYYHFPTTSIDPSPWPELYKSNFILPSFSGNISKGNFIHNFSIILKNAVMSDGTVSNPININSTEQITISEESNGTGESYFYIQDNLIGSCDRNMLPNSASISEINSICQNKYKQTIGARIVQEELILDSQNELNLTAYPNPTTGEVSFSLDLPSEGTVNLYVTDMLGIKVASLATNELLTKGGHVYSYNTTDLAGGVYLYTAEVNGIKHTKRLVVVK